MRGWAVVGAKKAEMPVYEGKNLDVVSYPLGGMGAGMFCLEGNGTLGQISVRHRPDLGSGSPLFAAICLKDHKGAAGLARVLEGPVPDWKVAHWAATNPWNGSNKGHIGGFHFGFPRFDRAAFQAEFPFARIELRDDELPLRAAVTGWSPFVPGDADSTGLPVAGLEYSFTNPTRQTVQAVFSFHAQNFMKVDGSAGQQPAHRVMKTAKGFALVQDALPDKKSAAGVFCIETDAPGAKTDACWFRGGWFDAGTILWQAIAEGRTQANPPVGDENPSGGGSLYVPLRIPAGKAVSVRILCSWYVPCSKLQAGPEQTGVDDESRFFRPWYASRFRGIKALSAYWRKRYDALRTQTKTFTNCFYDTTLPAEAVEAVAANLSILKSPTILRQHDGRLWGWEGSGDTWGSCHGTCTHVWNYAQALPHLFPALERTLRETEFLVSQDEKGHQNFRSALPIRPTDHMFHAAADGQLGGVLKVYREWRISGDTRWLKKLRPQVRKSLEFCIQTWDPDQQGAILEPHHNTYDIEFWGADGMCTSFYLAALAVAAELGRACGDGVALFEELRGKAKRYLEEKLWNGEYFIQNVQWKGLRAGSPVDGAGPDTIAANRNYSPEALKLLRKEGPKYQYGAGCLADGILGAWLAEVCGLPEVADPRKVRSHLLAVYKHNLKRDLRRHANPQRPGYALGREGGLLLCTWPGGGKPALPFVYSDEVWTGIEYQVAAHLISCGCVKEGLDIVRVLRARYEGNRRNPFNEYECGWWYARALASYALLEALGGARYDAVSRTLFLRPRVKGDYRVFLATATGYGTVGLRKGKPFVEVRQGRIDIERIELQA